MQDFDPHPVTSMLAYACFDADRVIQAREEGIHWSAPERALSFEFVSARDECRRLAGRLYVVDVYAAERRGHDPRSFIPPDALANAEPYLEPEAVAAGGGIITRREGGRLEVLLIYRRGAWDLPKGKLDEGESIRECALREVREEIGIQDVRIRRTLGETIHGYRDGARYVVKTTHWYEMETAARDFEPQAEEDIEVVRWVAWNEARGRLGYETLRRHMDRVEPLVRSVRDEGSPNGGSKP